AGKGDLDQRLESLTLARFTRRARRPLIRPVAADRDAVAVAPVRVIVPQRMMLGAAVVPERDRVRLPAKAHAELRRLDVAKQHGEDRIALVAAHADDAGGEEAVHEQAFAAGDRMQMPV